MPAAIRQLTTALLGKKSPFDLVIQLSFTLSKVSPFHLIFPDRIGLFAGKPFDRMINRFVPTVHSRQDVNQLH
jgi:hypothetical protein